jgi:anti-sigma regulatory factor (Ser/Thr protein kinase)
MLYYGIKPESFGQLGVLGKQIRNARESVAQLKVRFLRPYCVAYLDQFVSDCPHCDTIKIESTYPEVNQYLSQCKLAYLSPGAVKMGGFPQDQIIPLKNFFGKPMVIEKEVVDWIEKRVLEFLPKFDRKLEKKIVANLWEIVHNGIDHGESEHGVTACGQFYPLMGYFEIAFYDRGNGIPKLVREFGAIPTAADDSQCINWAVQKGNSTKPTSESAGLGLHLLREFLKINEGVFQIASGNGYFEEISRSNPAVHTLKNQINGTLVNIRVVFDPSLYHLKGAE